MADESSLINIDLSGLGQLGEPITLLITKISDAIGGYFRPYQIRRVASAEADAAIIEANAQIEVTDLQRRALARFLAEEGRKQENIENIIQLAIPQVAESANPQNIEDDWIVNFFDKCRLVSDNEMQSLWARVLAGEANSPGTYSKRTVDFLNSLDKSDAHLFTSLCGFCWSVPDFAPLIFDTQQSIYNGQNISFSTLNHLDDIGLLSFDAAGEYTRERYPPKFLIDYYETPLCMEFGDERMSLIPMGKAILTKIGQQLAPICGSKPVDGFQDYVIEHWSQIGFIFSSPYPRHVGSSQM